MSIAAILFDFDGTLLDTETTIYEVWCELFERHGATLDRALWQTTLGTHGALDPIAHLVDLLGRELPREELRRETREQMMHRCGELPLLPGAAERLAEARALGLRTAVASSSTVRWVTGWLDHHGLQEAFDGLSCRDHVERVKPAPDIFLRAAELLGVVPAECLVFEDSPNGATAAVSAGMRCVTIPSPLTSGLGFPPTDLVLGSLAEMSLGEILDRVDPRGAPVWQAAETA